MSYELIAILATAVFQSALLLVAIFLVFRTYRQTEANDAAIMLTIRRMDREIKDILREGKA